MVRRWVRKVKEHFQEVVKTKTSSHSIGLGFAIGTFISILPTPGFSIILGLLILLIFKRVNKFALFAGLIIWNPLTSIPIYYLSYQIGDLFFGQSAVVIYELTVFDQIFNFARRYLIGNLILAVTASITSYFLLKWGFSLHYRKNKES